MAGLTPGWLLTIMMAPLVTAQAPVPDNFLADKGNWTVTQGDTTCIMVTMAGQVSNDKRDETLIKCFTFLVSLSLIQNWR